MLLLTNYNVEYTDNSMVVHEIWDLMPISNLLFFRNGATSNSFFFVFFFSLNSIVYSVAQLALQFWRREQKWAIEN